MDRASREDCEVWYEWMVANLLYTRPAVRAYDLSVYGQQSVDKFGGLSGMTTLDSVLLAVLENDIPQALCHKNHDELQSLKSTNVIASYIENRKVNE